MNKMLQKLHKSCHYHENESNKSSMVTNFNTTNTSIFFNAYRVMEYDL